ncbi:MAG: hypothetical protein HKN76_14725 [Saprospiraceae bacterium]|nr:hypothetical protein [Saprospiraceae bacterium]
MRKSTIWIWIMFWILAWGCTRTLPVSISSLQQISTNSNVQRTDLAHLCGDDASYAPDTSHLDHTPIKYLRVNVHFMNSSDSTKNYSGERAKRFAQRMIAEATKGLENNTKMWLPINNETPALPTRYRYQLSASQGFEPDSGVYCHYDDDLYWFVSRGKNRNNYSRNVIQKYGIGLDSIINLFIVPHHPDSVISETYSVTSAGIALGSAVKISGVFETRKDPWAFKGIINHEIGHVLGLRHTWNGNDGCDDTPRNINCWNNTQPPPCDTAASNNLMDYNANQSAWTPCQIGKIHKAMSREGSLPRKMLVKNWCTYDSGKTITIRDSVSWQGAKDLEGDLVIVTGGVLEVHCRVSIPPGGKIIVESGGKLILHDARLHNSCGQFWNGIILHQDKRSPGEVIYYGDAKIENVASSPEPISE